MQGNGPATFLLRDMPGFKERLMLVVDADTNLRCNRHIGRITDLDHALDNLTEQIRLPRQRRTAATPGHLGYGASEIQIDVVGHVFVDDDFRSLFHDCWIHAIQLQRANLLAWSEMTQPQCFGIAGNQRARGDHFSYVQTVRPVAFANHAERPVGHSRHRRKHHRRLNMHRP